MFLWIVIYSFFESSDFVDEVIVLCGQSIFWFSVIVSVMIALGTLPPLYGCCNILIYPQPRGS